MSSVWVFLLLGMEAIRTYRSNPHLIIGTHHIPTWTTPLLLAVAVAALVPNTSLLGHLCGLGVGYIGMHCKASPVEDLHANMSVRSSWPRPCQVHRTAGMGTEMDRVET